MKPLAESIGITGLGLYLPEGRMTGDEIAALADLPPEVVKKKMGIIEKPIPGPEDHACNMGVRAAKEAIHQAGVDPRSIDVVIYIGEEHKEYPVWTAGIKLQHEVGAVNAWAFDTALHCGTTILGMKLAQSLMIADDSIRTVLLAGGYRNVDLVKIQKCEPGFYLIWVQVAVPCCCKKGIGQTTCWQAILSVMALSLKMWSSLQVEPSIPFRQRRWSVSSTILR